jgi:hypothetical protein
MRITFGHTLQNSASGGATDVLERLECSQDSYVVPRPYFGGAEEFAEEALLVQRGFLSKTGTQSWDCSVTKCSQPSEGVLSYCITILRKSPNLAGYESGGDGLRGL